MKTFQKILIKSILVPYIFIDFLLFVMIPEDVLTFKRMFTCTHADCLNVVVTSPPS